MIFTLIRKKIIKQLVIIALVLIGLSLLTLIPTFVFGHGNIFGLIPLFKLDSEANFPTLYSTALLSASAFLFYVLSKQEETVEKKASKKFKLMSAVMAFIALDEISSIHELLTEPLLLIGDFDGVFFHAWVIAAIPLLIILFFYLFRFLLSQPKEFRNGLISAAFIYISGALGMEMLEGYFASIQGRMTILSAVFANIEESFEIFGLIVLINTLLKFALKKENLQYMQFSIHIKER